MAGGKLTLVEAGRGVAAMLVVACHAPHHVEQNIGFSPFGSLFDFAHSGVDFFFVLSGFIILYVHARDLGQPHRLGHFLEKRFIRIFPFYWVMIAISLAVLAASPHRSVPGIGEVVANLGLVNSGVGIVPVSWTLQHELVFYCLFSVSILSVRAGLIVLGLWAAGILAGLAGIFTDTSSTLLYRLTAPFDIEFFFGLATARVLQRRTIPMPFLFLFVGPALFVLTGLAEDLTWLDGHRGGLPRLLYGSASAMFLLGAVELERQGKIRMPKLMLQLGIASYTIYLVHELAIGTIWKGLGAAGFLGQLPWSVVTVMLIIGPGLIGMAVSRLVEQPSMRICRELLDRVVVLASMAGVRQRSSRPRGAGT
jgi:exopolysaccharide production protein ExoZ